MVFFCQRNCYEIEYESEVTSCKKTSTTLIKNGKKQKVDCFEVLFKDTVFFPEGGGQPDDRGTVGGVNVLKVERRGDQAVHYTDGEVEEGKCIRQIIDWDRRHDHMQQHSGQHLVTAVAETLFDLKTFSWYMGEKTSYIEMNKPSISEDQITQIEHSVNQKIRSGLKVEIKEYDLDDPQLEKIRTRGLPDDVCGPVRMVSIEGVDENLCCGTHVSSLADLQAIKITHTEKGKSNNTLLHFIAGKRVLNYLSDCLKRERSLNTLLHSCPEEYYNLVENTQKNLKVSNKRLKDALQDLAQSQAQKFLSEDPRPKVFFHHRPDGDMDYLNAIIKHIDDESVLKVLTAGDKSGVVLVHGPPQLVLEVGPKLCEILEGKGGGKNRFTGKVNNLKNLKKAKEFIMENYFQD